MSLKRFDDLVGELRQTLAGLSDKRKGSNTMYSMETIGLSAFSVFFTQSPSFLAYQKTMEQNKGQSNAQTLFQIEKTPSDNHIRDRLDPVEPQEIPSMIAYTKPSGNRAFSTPSALYMTPA